MAKGISSSTHTQDQLNHHSNQRNPNSNIYKAAMNNHSNQRNPNSNAYKAARDNHANQCNPNHK